MSFFAVFFLCVETNENHLYWDDWAKKEWTHPYDLWAHLSRVIKWLPKWRKSEKKEIEERRETEKNPYTTNKVYLWCANKRIVFLLFLHAVPYRISLNAYNNPQLMGTITLKRIERAYGIQKKTLYSWNSIFIRRHFFAKEKEYSHSSFNVYYFDEEKNIYKTIITIIEWSAFYAKIFQLVAHKWMCVYWCCAEWNALNSNAVHREGRLRLKNGERLRKEASNGAIYKIVWNAHGPRSYF